MKEKDIEYINKTICKFIQDISLCQDEMIEEAPDVWQGMLMSLSTLSSISMFLEAAKKHEQQKDLDFYNALATANGLPPRKELPPNLMKNHKERDIDLSKFKAIKGNE